jgi:hypothetical protein
MVIPSQARRRGGNYLVDQIVAQKRGTPKGFTLTTPNKVDGNNGEERLTGM